MTREQQIKKMAKEIDERLLEANLVLGSMNSGKGHWIAEYLVDIGYCKKEVVSKQVAKDILEEFWRIQYGQTELDNVCIRLAEKYGLLKELQGE